jgi:hypothetical protein
MSVFLTFATAIATGWIIDRLAFRGELTGMIRDEIALIRSRRKLPPKAARSARRG